MATRTKSRSALAKAVDRQLARYRSMRDFEVTSEPQGIANKSGSIPTVGPQPFVVQKHAATRLHYDFRLGWHGVLKSWAVTKGPSYFPGDKRLAVEVEDHPMEYGGFEGTIPKGQYGGGTVMIWDFGEWKALGDVDREIEKGNLKFELYGTKLKGKWALIRMHRNLDHSDKPGWLLIKERDECPIGRCARNHGRSSEQCDHAKNDRTDCGKQGSHLGLKAGGCSSAEIIVNTCPLATSYRVISGTDHSNGLCAVRLLKYFPDLFNPSWRNQPLRPPIATNGSTS